MFLDQDFLSLSILVVYTSASSPPPRRMMIEKIAAHLADFSPRLYSNTRALYQYCPIPVVSFPQLDNELFCNIYYLRHLCDDNRFPNWPIREPVCIC